MKTHTHERSALRLRRYLPWVVLYLAILGGTTAFGAQVYEKYDTHHLPSGGIELTVDQTAYQLGETVGFTVTNHFPVPVYVQNQCPEEPLNVYRWENNAWVQLHATAPADGECYGQERDVGVLSEDTRSYDYGDWPDLFATPGTYRIAADIGHYSDIPFQDFVVLAPPEVIEVIDPPEIRYVTETVKPEIPVVIPTPVPEPAIVIPVVYEDEEEEEEDREESEHENEEEEEDEDD